MHCHSRTSMGHTLHRFASCGGDRQVFLWDVSTGRTIRKFRGHDGVVNSVSPHPSSTSGKACRPTVPFDEALLHVKHSMCESLRPIFVMPCIDLSTHPTTGLAAVNQTELSREAFWSAVITDAGLSEVLGRVQLCMGPGEETLVSGGYDQAVRVWDMRSRSYDAVQTIKLFADSVTAVAVSARYLVFRGYAQASATLSTGTESHANVSAGTVECLP